MREPPPVNHAPDIHGQARPAESEGRRCNNAAPGDPRGARENGEKTREDRENRPQDADATEATPRTSFYDILAKAKAQISPEDLFKKSGFDDETVDEFFDELKREVGEGRVKEQKTGTSVWLKAAS